MTTPDVPPAPSAVEELLSVLALERVGTAEVSFVPGIDAGPRREAGDVSGGSDGNAALSAHETEIFAEHMTVFVGQSQKMPHGRVFGGQVLAQGVMACGLTVNPEPSAPPRPIHSLHAYFMRPGDDTKPIHFAVETMRDGRSFSTRRAHAIQHGKPILTISCSFQEAAEGLDHQDAMPDVPGPEGLTSPTDLFAGIDHPAVRHLVEGRAIEQRHVEGPLYISADPELRAKQHVWMTAKEQLPDDPLIHAAVLAYSSDYGMLEPVLRRHGRRWGDGTMRVASLDHAMWFHRPVRVDDWILFVQESPSAQGSRGLGIARMFSRDGSLVATVAQEGMLRVSDLD